MNINWLKISFPRTKLTLAKMDCNVVIVNQDNINIITVK